MDIVIIALKQKDIVRFMIYKTDQQALESPKKRQIVEAAFNLFKARGFYATGVDLIMQTANVSKRTLYKYFPTKNDE